MARVRAATPTDAPAVATVHVRSWREAYAGHMPDDLLAGLDVPARTRAWAQRLAQPRPGTRTLVAVAGGNVVGFVHTGPSRDPGVDDPTVLELRAIYIDPDALGTGAGAALMRAVLADAAAAGMSEIRLWVLRDNARARAFYEHFGFAPDGAVDMYEAGEGDGRVQVPEVRYVRPAGSG
jgi:ribosomal protein S18 acetylase RimI-like enzyme